MATFNKFNSFVDAVAAGTHAQVLADPGTDTVRVYLSNTAPSATLDLLKADLAEITNQNGYTAPVDVQNTASTTTGTITVVGVDVVITASGTVGPFQYVVLYNDTATDDPLIGWWDYGSPITLNDGETFTVDFGASLFTIS